MLCVASVIYCTDEVFGLLGTDDAYGYCGVPLSYASGDYVKV